VAEQLMTLAANYLELAERALRSRQPVTAVRQQLNVVQKEQTTSGSSANEVFWYLPACSQVAIRPGVLCAL
jgi:hypothetical protein